MKIPKSLVFLWYLPILIVLSTGLWMSLEHSTAENVVQKAKEFKTDESKASKTLETLRTDSYGFQVNLDETFNVSLYDFKDKGDFRAGDKIEIPYVVKAPAGREYSSLRLELAGPGDQALLAGFTRLVRSCDTPWTKIDGHLACAGPSTIVVPGGELTSDSFALFDLGEAVSGAREKYYLIQIGTTPDLILPVEGYTSSLSIKLTGLNVKK